MLQHSKHRLGLDRPDCHHGRAQALTQLGSKPSKRCDYNHSIAYSAAAANGCVAVPLAADRGRRVPFCAAPVVLNRCQSRTGAAAPAAAASAGSNQATAPPADAAADDDDDADAASNDGGGDVLGNFLTWLLANGVQGIGTADAAVGLYEEACGERGIVALRDVARGEVVLRVPLRLAVTDAPDDASAALACGGRAWQDRLAARLLRLDAAGAGSPWRPYMAALPRRVPCAFETFNGDAIAAVEYPPAVERLRSHSALLMAKLRAAQAAGGAALAAIGGADEAKFRWAHSVVGSRAFGNAAPGGGVGVRMLVPLVDMLNHCGDRTAGLLSGEAYATDNVRWDVVGPQSAANATGAWEMAVSAKRAVGAGEPLALSYFEGPNDEFLLHYGFVPPANPHDDAVLAPCVAAALEELWRAEAPAAAAAEDGGSSGSGSGGGGALAALSAAYMRALAAGNAALSAEVEAALGGDSGGGGSGSGDADTVISALEVIRAQPGGRVSEPLAAALDALCATDGNGAATGGGGDGNGRRAEFLMAALARARLREMPTPLLADLAALVVDARLSSGSTSGSDGDDDGDGDGDFDDDGIAAAFEAQLAHYHALLSRGGVAAGGAAESASALAQRILRESGAGAPPRPPPLARELRLAIEFRAAKKMVLWDLVAAVAAAAGEAPAALAERLDGFWAASGGSGGGGSGGGGSAPPPPWQAHLAAADAPVWGAADE